MNAPTPAAPTLRVPLDVGGWVRYFRLVEIPIFASTAVAIEELRLVEDDVDARLLSEVISRDPLMSLKLLAFASSQGANRRLSDAETVTEALVLMGITPFFRVFGPQPTIEEHLGDQPLALAGLRGVLARADRASRFSALFAIHRNDHDVAVLQEAALLHDFTELLLWLYAPGLAHEIKRRQDADPTLRTATVQRELLNAELNEVQQALMKIWRLPELLVRTMDDRQARNSQVRNVLLAIRLARHTMNGWQNAAIPDDLHDIAEMLHMSVGHAEALVRDIDLHPDGPPLGAALAQGS